jgi:hypothetical protein
MQARLQHKQLLIVFAVLIRRRCACQHLLVGCSVLPGFLHFINQVVQNKDVAVGIIRISELLRINGLNMLLTLLDEQGSLAGSLIIVGD